MEKERICFQSDEELRKEIDAVAKQTGTNRSAVIRWAVRFFLSEIRSDASKILGQTIIEPEPQEQVA